MTSHKKRERARRQVERTMQQAFEAVSAGEFALADKLSRRATDAGFMNPRIWCDRGRIAQLSGDPVEAEKAFRHAIAIAPGYGDARVELGRLLAARGKLEQAARVLERGLELRPDDRELAGELSGLPRSRAGAGPERAVDPTPSSPLAEPEWTERTSRFDWGAVAGALLRDGVAVLEGFVDSETRVHVRAVAAQAVEQEFARDDDGARAVWRFVREPLSGALAAIRAELFARLAPIAEQQHARLGRAGGFGGSFEAFLAARGGSRRSTVAVILLEPGGHVGPQLAAADEFPFAVQVALGPEVGFAHALHDLRPGRRERARRTRLGVGDALVFAVRERCVRIAGVDARQEVAPAIAPIGDRGSAVLELRFGAGA